MRKVSGRPPELTEHQWLTLERLRGGQVVRLWGVPPTTDAVVELKDKRIIRRPTEDAETIWKLLKKGALEIRCRGSTRSLRRVYISDKGKDWLLKWRMT
jgi:hypothetical protein